MGSVTQHLRAGVIKRGHVGNYVYGRGATVFTQLTLMAIQWQRLGTIVWVVSTLHGAVLYFHIISRHDSITLNSVPNVGPVIPPYCATQ